MSYCTRFKDSGLSVDETKSIHTDEETAIVYQQFIKSFEEPVNVNKTWVKGGTVNPGSSTYDNDNSGSLYQPHIKSIEKSANKLTDKIQFEINKKPPLLGKLKEQNKKKSNLELLCDELKQNQQDQELRQMRRRQSGIEELRQRNKEDTEIRVPEDQRKHRIDMNVEQNSKSQLFASSTQSSNDFDFQNDSENDRTTTTNLYLGNLNPELTEKQLCELFGRFGPLASVKIMWPRSGEEKARTRNFGFVAYMNRIDCERAFMKLNGIKVCGYEMKLGWGKTVIIPPFPVYIPPPLMELIKSPPPSGLPFNAQPREWLDSPNVERKIFDIYSMSDEELTEILNKSVVKVTVPIDRPLLQLINRMIEFVVREGVEFEAFIMNREIRNTNFRFLYDFQSPEHVYYRWKLYSILHGESSKQWKTEEFLMYVGGPYWRPPPLNPFTSGLPEELIEDIDFSKLTLENISQTLTTNELTKEYQSRESTNQANDVCMENPYSHNHIYKRQLTANQRERFMQVLIDLEPVKSSIGEAMVWCLEHSDSAEDVLDMIVKQIEKTIGYATDKTIENSNAIGLNQIVALLFLISDILHNSCAKVRNASFYRKYIENSLPQIMTCFNQYYLTMTSKVKSEQLKHKVLSCFRAWGDWYVYPFELLQRLKNQFLGIEESLIEGKVNVSEENLIGNQRLVDYDGDPLDVDGVPLESSDNADGVPIESTNNNEMLDMFANPTSPQTKTRIEKPALFVPSKWETVDTIEEESEMVQSRWQMLEQQQLEEDKKRSDNEDPDGYPLSDSEHFTLDETKYRSCRYEQNLTIAKEINEKHGLVSYSVESDESLDEEEKEREKRRKSNKKSSSKYHSDKHLSSPEDIDRRSVSSKNSKYETREQRQMSTSSYHCRSSEKNRSNRSSRDSRRHHEQDCDSKDGRNSQTTNRGSSRRSRTRSRSNRRKSHKKRKSINH